MSTVAFSAGKFYCRMRLIFCNDRLKKHFLNVLCILMEKTNYFMCIINLTQHKPEYLVLVELSQFQYYLDVLHF